MKPTSLMMLSMLPLAACDGVGPQCIVDDEAGARAAVAGICSEITVTGSSFTDLQAFSDLDRPIALVTVSNNPLLESTQGLPPISGHVFLLDNGRLEFVDVTANALTVAPSPSQPRVRWVAQFREGRVATLQAGLIPELKVEAASPGVDVILNLSPRADLVTTVTPDVNIVRLTWRAATPASLATLQAFGPIAQREPLIEPQVGATANATFGQMAAESFPLLAAYRDWLAVESPNATIQVTDEAGNDVDL